MPQSQCIKGVELAHTLIEQLASVLQSGKVIRAA